MKKRLFAVLMILALLLPGFALATGTDTSSSYTTAAEVLHPEW